ncbi:MAG: 2-amino-4-hydroxy-6-hydroxymethyldihydropteridine diphosphokinase [Pseudomonadota bacterium]
MVQLSIAAPQTSPAIVAFGSNLGDGNNAPLDTLRDAAQCLMEKGVSFVNQSKSYRTPAVPAGAGPDYVNAVAEIRTDLCAREFLALLHEVEADFGRVRDQRWASRSLDLDLLSYDDVIVPDLATFNAWRALDFRDQQQVSPTEMILPHPRIQDRAFVLVPLAEIAPDWRHPVLNQTAAELCAALPAADRLAVVPLDPG